jgi:hypothetical protein
VLAPFDPLTRSLLRTADEVAAAAARDPGRALPLHPTPRDRRAAGGDSSDDPSDDRLIAVVCAACLGVGLLGHVLPAQRWLWLALLLVALVAVWRWRSGPSTCG